MYRLFVLLVMVGLGAGLCGPAGAQDITGSIVGTITDAQGAAVSQATVQIANTDKNIVVRTVETDDRGAYSAPLLPTGHYTLTVEKAGFKKFTKTGIELNVSDRLTVNASLQVGAVSDSVSVQADPLQVETQDVAAAGLINGTQIRELSINNRNYIQLVALMPGVSTSFASDQVEIGVTSQTGKSNAINISINGNRATQNNYSIDGADNLDRGSNLTLLNYPNPDAIAEFKVLRGQYDPEYGRSSSGEINVITRGGGSQFHGGLYEFFRNDVLEANRFFNNQGGIPRPPLRYNNFGGTFGGPLFIPGHYNTSKQKTFFFFSEDVRRIKTSTTFVATVPSKAERTGDFSRWASANAATLCLSRNCSVTGTQVTKIDPAAAAYIQDIFSNLPEPQDLDTDSLTSVGQNVFNHRQENIRIDHVFNSKFTVFGRFINDSIPTIEPGGLFTGSALPGVATTSTNAPGRGFSLRATWTISPNMLNEFGYAYSYGAITSEPVGLGATKSATNIAAAIKLPFASTITRVPDLNFGDNEGVFGFGPYRDFNRNHNWFDNFTKIAGRHTMKFGATYHRYQKDENAAAGNNGSFSFDDTLPSGGGNSRQEWANFLQGLVTNFSQNSIDFAAKIRQNQLELYAQDAFRVRRNLTFTYGLRYSLFGQVYDDLGQATTFDPRAYNSANAPQIDSKGLLVPGTGTPLNGIIIAGKTSPYGGAVARRPTLLFAPRLGFAWDPFKNGLTSIRGGYGIFFDSPSINYLEQFEFSNPPFAQTISISDTSLGNPGSVSPDQNLTPPFLGGPAANWHQPYTQQWSLDAQHQVWKGVLVDIGYYGSDGVHLLGLIDINQPPVGAAAAAGFKLPVGSGLATQKLNRIRPFQGYGAINIFTPTFNSNYHSLQFNAQKRFSGSSLIGVNYTYSHAITNSQGDISSAMNGYDVRAEYGPARFDRRNVFNLNFVYELPFLRASQNAVAKVILGGWEVSGIVYAYSGLPLTATQRRDPAGLGLRDPNSFAGGRPDEVSDPNSAAPHTVAAWFNTAAFASGPVGRPGNAGRGSIIGPGAQRWDLSLFKNIPIHESLRMQFRAETFNVFNHTNFDAVTTRLGSSLFGRVTSARDPRIIQLGLKLNF